MGVAAIEEAPKNYVTEPTAQIMRLTGSHTALPLPPPPGPSGHPPRKGEGKRRYPIAIFASCVMITAAPFSRFSGVGQSRMKTML